MAPSTSSDVASTATATSLGKRARSPPSRLTDISNGNGDGNGNRNGEGAESSDDDDLGPMPMPMPAGGQDEGDAAAAGTSKAAAAVKRRKILRHEKVYLENVPSADRYYRGPACCHGPAALAITLLCAPLHAARLPIDARSRSPSLSRVSVHAGSFMHRDVVSHVAVTKCVSPSPILSSSSSASSPSSAR